MDERQLASIITEQGTTNLALPDPAAGMDMTCHGYQRHSLLFIFSSATAIPMNSVAEPHHLEPGATP